MVRKRGSVLILTALLLVIAVAIAGEVFHLSRVMLEAKQLERAVEPAALGAALELDTTRAGIIRAERRARELADREIAVEFAPAAEGPWNVEVARPEAIRLVRVTARQSGDRPLSRRAVAAQRVLTVWDSGISPFAAPAAATPGAIQDLAYIGGILPRDARLAVERGIAPLRPGDDLRAVDIPGEARLALDRRLRSDSDTASSTYAEYLAEGKGNGHRILPVVLRGVDGKASEVAAFFLPAQWTQPLRGEFAGGYLQGGRFRAVAETGYSIAEVVR